PDRIQPRWVTNATASCSPVTATPYSVEIGFVNQLVTHGISRARLASAPTIIDSPRRFSRHAIAPRLIDVIAYDPSNPNANTLPSRNSSPPVGITSSTVAVVITTIAPRGVP